MRVFKRGLAGVALGAFLAAGIVAPAQADVPESDDAIIIAINEWTGQHISAHVVGNILSRMGYNVEYVTAAVLPMATAIADGDIHYGSELWDNNLGEYFPSLLADGSVADMGDVGIDGREGWVYPIHLEQDCPGLPEWQAFLDCYEMFGTAETFPNGRFVDYPADWASRAGDMIAAEGLPFDVIPAGSEGALVAELKSAEERKAPLVMMFWAPHWALFEHQVGWVDMPADLAEKYSLQPPRVFKTGWPGMEQKWPAAWRFINDFRIDNAMQEELMGRIDNNGEDLVTVIDEWVEANPDKWQPYVDRAMAGS